MAQKRPIPCPDIPKDMNRFFDSRKFTDHSLLVWIGFWKPGMFIGITESAFESHKLIGVEKLVKKIHIEYCISIKNTWNLLL